MARIVGYIAASLDGFIAAENGNLDWLFKYDGGDMGEHDYRTFIKGIRTVVMGRGTYDFIAESDALGLWRPESHRRHVKADRDPEGAARNTSGCGCADHRITDIRRWRCLDARRRAIANGISGTRRAGRDRNLPHPRTHWRRHTAISCNRLQGEPCSPQRQDA